MLIIGLCSIIFFYISYRFYKAYCLAYENCHPRRTIGKKFEKIPYKTKSFSFTSKDNILINAIEWIPNVEIRGTVIACHYLGGSKNVLYTYIEPLLREGYRVTAFDYVNHGDSMDRKSLRFNLEDDMKNFICKLKELGINGPYATIGFSMGASIALSTSVLCEDVKAVVVDSGPLIFPKEYVAYVLHNKRVSNPIDKLIFKFLFMYVVGFGKMSRKMKKDIKRYYKIPILIIHGKNDHIISIHNTEFLFQQLDHLKSKRIVVDKSYHLTNKLLLGNQYNQLIIEFLNRHLLEKI